MKKNVLIMLLLGALTITSCNKQQNQAQTDTTDGTAVDTTEAVVEEPYNFEALAKTIDGCTNLYRFEDGVAFMDKDGERVYFDLQGRKVEKPKEKVDPNALRARYENGKYGFVNGEDKLVIPYQYDFALDFSDGMALVCDKNGWIGYINTKGELVIPYKYDNPAERNGNDFHEGLCAVMVDGEHEWFSYIDKTGELAFPGIFSQDGDFSEGLAAVRTTGEDYRSGYIDHTGKMVITLPEGWWGRKFKDGVAQIQKVDSCFIIDKTGKRLFQVNNNIIYTGDDIIFSDGLAVVYGKGKYENKRGFMDKTGRITFCLGEE
jgi:hypothetical protein